MKLALQALQRHSLSRSYAIARVVFTESKSEDTLRYYTPLRKINVRGRPMSWLASSRQRQRTKSSITKLRY
eukprot:4448364-Amphidinium_carterae.1